MTGKLPIHKYTMQPTRSFFFYAISSYMTSFLVDYEFSETIVVTGTVRNETTSWESNWETVTF